MQDKDPTAIDIAFDPLRQKLSGVTVHGAIPFSVPFITQITPDLFIGGCASGLVLPADIGAVVSLYPWERYERGKDVLYVEHRMYDSETRPIDGQLVMDLAKYVNDVRKSHKTLVHCQAGLNRSALIVATALMLVDSRSADNAIARLRELRSPAVLCNEKFVKWLQAADLAGVHAN